MKKPVFSPRAVIFDMDGVIVDSMPYHFIAWYEALRPWGIRVSCFDVYAKEGERWEKTLKALLREEGIVPSPGNIRKIFIQRQKIFKRYFKRFIFKGSREFVLCLKNKGYLLGLVTGTPLPEVNKILPSAVREAFSCLVTGDRVRHGKPHPEPYLKAARLLGVKPKDCVVVENAPLGIRSAKRAGMFCVAVSTSLPKEYLQEADVIVGHLEEVMGIVEKGCGIARRS